jgi:4-alpha-glucanotransferase
LPSTVKKPDSYLIRLGRRAGVGLHISSLPGRYGIGDIADDSHAFLQTLSAMGIGAWQILPLGPTAYGDSPYQPLSAFAGNPMLIGPVPLVRSGLLDAEDLEPLLALPADHVDLTRAAERFRTRPGSGLQAAYQEFLHRCDEAWLDDYALFRVIKMLHDERAWPEWGSEYLRRERGALDLIRARHGQEIECIKITQFFFDQQWQALRSAWARPGRLLLSRDGRPDRVAGVPPDYFSEDGQLWGNPLYEWSHHRETGYRWWIERVRHAAGQTELVRIDHFRGFESYWSVPFGASTARVGTWQPGPGDELFLALREAIGDLPIVAEDLGVITPEVVRLRSNHGIPGMVVLQFEVGDPAFGIGAVEENSVCYTGTHDNDTTVGWFNSNGDDTRSEKEAAGQRVAALERTGGSPETIHLDMIRLAFSTRASLAVAPMQDFLGLGSEARLNIPGTTLDNWRWRLLPGQVTPELVESVAGLVGEASRERPVRIDSTA